MAAAAWDPAHKNAGANLSNGNLTVDATGGSFRDSGGRSTVFISAGEKRYWEVTHDHVVGFANGVGICNTSEDFAGFFGGSPNAYSLMSNSNVYNNGSPVISLEQTFDGDIIDVAVDYSSDGTTLLAWWRINGQGDWNNRGPIADPATGVLGVDASSLLPGPIFLGYNQHNDGAGDGSQSTANFGATPFVHTMPAGFSSFAEEPKEGSLAVTLGALTAAATGTVLARASLSATLGSLTAIASGKVPTRATLDATLASLDFEAHGRLAVAASLAETLGSLTASSSGEITAEATLDETLGSLAIDAHCEVSSAATLAPTLGLLTLMAQGHGPQEEIPAGRIQLVGIMQQTSVPQIATAWLSVPQMATAERRIRQRGLIDG